MQVRLYWISTPRNVFAGVQAEKSLIVRMSTAEMQTGNLVSLAVFGGHTSLTLYLYIMIVS